MVPGLPRTETSTYSSMYQFDTSVRWILPIRRRLPRYEAGESVRGRSDVLELAILGLLAETPMHGYELRKRLNLLLGSFRALSYGSLYPCLKGLAERRRGRVADAATACPVGQAGPDRLRAHCRRQGAPCGDAGDVRPLRLGGRPLRGAVRPVLPDRRRDPAADPGGASHAPDRAAGPGPPGRDPYPGADRRVHPRTPAARPGTGRAGGPLAGWVDRQRARHAPRVHRRDRAKDRTRHR